MAKMIELKDEGIKYYKVNRQTNTVILFNLNNTVYKTIKLNIPNDQMFDEVKLVSKYQINSDDLLEIAFTTIQIVSNEQEMGYSEMKPLLFTLNVTNEIGEELLIVPGANHFRLLNHKDKKALIVFREPSNNKNAAMITEIYTIHD